MFENMNFINYSQLSSKCVTSVLYIYVCPPETLKDFFEKHFGEVTECHIMKDQVTKKSR